MNKININAPIMPGEGLGGLQLNTHILQLKELIKSFSWLDHKTLVDKSIDTLSTFYVSYECRNTLKIVFDILTGNLQRIIALQNYKGSFLNELYIGKEINSIQKLDIIYDEDEELYYVDGFDGITFEADVTNHYITCITVYSLEI